MALVDEFKGIAFDYGGVLVHHQSEEDQAKLAEVAGLPLERFTELYWSFREEYDKAHLTGPEYWATIAKAAGTVFSPDVVQKLTEVDTMSWLKFDEVMWEWVAQLGTQGKRLAILSNMPPDLGFALKAGTDRFTRFDHVTLSYEVRSAKPEPQIYENCLEGLGTAPEETLFLDDRIANVQGAELLGIRAIQFLDRDDMLLRLRA